MKIKILLTFFIVITLFFSGCVTKEEVKPSEEKGLVEPVEKEVGDLILYENKSLGISFKYPSNFKIIQYGDDTLRVESDYKNPELWGISIGMNVMRLSMERESLESIESRINAGVGLPGIEKKTYRLIQKGTYDIVEISDGGWFILSDRGTFLVGDSTDAYKETLEQEGLYQHYRTIFDDIRDSIKII